MKISKCHKRCKTVAELEIPPLSWQDRMKLQVGNIVLQGPTGLIPCHKGMFGGMLQRIRYIVKTKFFANSVHFYFFGPSKRLTEKFGAASVEIGDVVHSLVDIVPWK